MNTPSSRKIRVGIIGVGNWGRYGHIPVLRLLPNYEIVAVASRREEYGKQLAKEFGMTLFNGATGLRAPILVLKFTRSLNLNNKGTRTWQSKTNVWENTGSW
jgi:hypothetical protein